MTMVELPHQSFARFCDVANRIAQTRGTSDKTRIFAQYLESLRDDIKTAQLAVTFMGEGAFSAIGKKSTLAGHRTIALCAAQFCEIDYDLVFRACRTATGSSSEAIEKLMENLDEARSKMKPASLSLEEVQNHFTRLANERSRDGKKEILFKAWSEMSPVEARYFIRIMGSGSLRIGFEAKSILQSIALAWSGDPEEVRYAHMVSGSLAETVLLCGEGRLDEARFKLFNPVAFMLASPIEDKKVDDLKAFIAEEKFDGMRCQLHVSDGQVKLFSRDLNEVSHSFPDVTGFIQRKKLPPSVFDGELCVYKDGAILSFQQLQKRMGIKKPSQKTIMECPVVFIAFDLLYHEGIPLFHSPLTKRREILEDICKKNGIKLANWFEVGSENDIADLFAKALSRGNEGLVLKKKTSVYEFGRRGSSWLKVKQPGGSIDTVIMYAHAGSGKRGGTYSDFTLGVSVKDDPRYPEDFIPIGKAYSGYTDEELKKLNQAIRPLAVERFGPTLSLKPGIVIEIEFDDIMENRRTKAGYTLRFPRFRRIRWDLSPNDADTLEDVERLFKQKMGRVGNESPVNASFLD